MKLREFRSKFDRNQLKDATCQKVTWYCECPLTDFLRTYWLVCLTFRFFSKWSKANKFSALKHKFFLLKHICFALQYKFSILKTQILCFQNKNNIRKKLEYDKIKKNKINNFNKLFNEFCRVSISTIMYS